MRVIVVVSVSLSGRGAAGERLALLVLLLQLVLKLIERLALDVKGLDQVVVHLVAEDLLIGSLLHLRHLAVELLQLSDRQSGFIIGLILLKGL